MEVFSMKGTKILKAFCRKSKQHFGLEIKNIGGRWVVVNFTDLTEAEAELIYSEIKQDSFVTDPALLPCLKCGSRTVGGCNCSSKNHSCSKDTGYHFDCVYCRNLEIDYSLPSAAAIRGREGEKITLAQGKEVKVVTFSNVRWEKFDNIQSHPKAPMYHEPKVHVVANQENIEFHGYNISEMDEGVFYTIDENDDFVIECDVDTSTIKPHPGGNMYISLGIITATLMQTNGCFYLDNKVIAQVGSKFHMKLSLTNGTHYEVEIDNRLCCSTDRQSSGKVKIIFGFKHGSHDCRLLSHAYVKGIKMQQAISRQ